MWKRKLDGHAYCEELPKVVVAITKGSDGLLENLYLSLSCGISVDECPSATRSRVGVRGTIGEGYQTIGWNFAN